MCLFMCESDDNDEGANSLMVFNDVLILKIYISIYIYESTVLKIAVIAMVVSFGI